MTGQGLADFSTFLSYFIAVFIALGIVLLLAWLSIRLLAGRLGSFGLKGRNIKVLETMPLGYKRSLHIVEVSGKVLLLGSSDGGISVLAQLESDKLVLPDPKGKLVGSRFLDILKGKKTAGKPRLP
ncbi:MAG: flagellar biosynthetic protein FliO [Pseudomonadota bacterium]